MSSSQSRLGVIAFFALAIGTIAIPVVVGVVAALAFGGPSHTLDRGALRQALALRGR